MYLKWNCFYSSWCGLCYVWEAAKMFQKFMNFESFNNNNGAHWWKRINYSKFVCCRTEAKVWSPLVSEEGKTHPYKMNLASEPQVSPGITVCCCSLLFLWENFQALSSKELSTCHSVNHVGGSIMPHTIKRSCGPWKDRLPPSWWEACCCGELKLSAMTKETCLGQRCLLPSACSHLPQGTEGTVEV